MNVQITSLKLHRNTPLKNVSNDTHITHTIVHIDGHLLSDHVACTSSNKKMPMSRFKIDLDSYGLLTVISHY